MERAGKRREQRNIRTVFTRLAVPLVLGLSSILTACAPKAIEGNSQHTPIVEATPIVMGTDIPIPVIPTIASTPTFTPTLQPSPSPIIVEQPTPTPPKIVCKYYSGSSSYDRLGRYLFNRYEGERTIDESKGYSVITMKELSGNMVIFITKSGAMISFISEVIANKDALRLLPCDPSQVVEVDILIGGNNETNVNIPKTDISDEIVDVSRKLPKIYPKANLTVHLPYITKEDTDEVWDRRNWVDADVTVRLQGVEKVTVVPLSRFVVSGKTILGNFEDTLHMDPEFLLRLMGGKQRIFSFSRN